MKIRWILIAFTGLILLIVSLYTWLANAKLVSEYNRILDRWKAELSSLRVAPTPENVFGLQREYEWIVNKEKEVLGLLSEKRLQYPDLTPLQFKEELLNSQIKLKQLAYIQDVKLQEDLGFPEYIHGEIPLQEDVPLLGKQLIVINELVNIFLRHKVSKINSIQKLPCASVEEGNEIYRIIAFKIELECTLEDLLGVLIDIMNAPYTLVVKSMDVKKLNEIRVGVGILIGAVEF